jgi:glycogen debranching enzyme
VAAVTGNRVVLGTRAQGRQTSIRMTPLPQVSPAGTAWWEADIPARGEWSACLELAPIIDEQEVIPRYCCGQPVTEAEPHTRLREWQHLVPRVDSDISGLSPAIARAADDLGALRIFDPEHPGRPVIAAGAPWYMTLFGRDSILTSYMSLFFDPDLGLSVAETLARLQGTKLDPATEEEPGRILHEVRFASTASLALGSGEIYYGTADATPLFVMLVGELLRWGTPIERLHPLLPAVEAALTWMTDHGDADGDGYVEYSRQTAAGLLNQGWKDSGDGVSYADGRLPDGPVALCEVQAYCYAAWHAAAQLAQADGDTALATDRLQRAKELRVAFNRDFWMPDTQTFAIGLDGDKGHIDSITSNPGHCLWAGIVDDDKARGVVASLTSPEMFSGWGIRTLSTAMARYNPVSYHNGSIWPHDTAICAAGMRRYGFQDEASRVAIALLAAAGATDDRLPELFSGLSIDDFPTPVAYPTSCSPQAWASAAPLLLARMFLGIEPDIPSGTLGFHPALPEETKRLIVRGLPVAGFRVNVICDDALWTVNGLPEGIRVVETGS